MQNDKTLSANAVLSSGSGGIQPDIVQHNNIDQEYILITKDKLINKLNNYLSKLEDQKAWWAPFGMFITLVIVPLTTEFKNTVGIPAATLQAMCYFGIIYFLLATVRVGWKSFKAKDINTHKIIDEIIAESKTLKNQSQQTMT